jgi:hypothetical protein
VDHRLDAQISIPGGSETKSKFRSHHRAPNLSRHERAECSGKTAYDNEKGAYETFEARPERLCDGGLQSALTGQGKRRIVQIAFELERNPAPEDSAIGKQAKAALRGSLDVMRTPSD